MNIDGPSRRIISEPLKAPTTPPPTQPTQPAEPRKPEPAPAR